MFRRAIIAAALVVLAALPAQARHRGTNAAPQAAPILTATTYTLGQQTQAFFGYAYYHTQDQTIPSYIPFTTSGLGLMSPSGPACDTWYTTYVSGRASTDFQISASVADASAITPLVTFTGQGNLTGDYVFNVQCSRLGVFSNTVALTIHTIANALNIGAQDNIDGGNWYPSGFGSVAGAKVLISTGTDWHGLRNRLRGSLSTSAGSHTTVTIADSGRYPYITDFTITGIDYIDISNVVAVGDADIDAAGTLFGIVGPSTSQGNTLINLHYYGSAYTIPRSANNSGQDAFDLSFCTASCVLQDSTADFVGSGYNVSPGLHVTNVDIAHYNNNCVGIFSGSSASTIDGFSTCRDPILNQYQALHVDCMQIFDGATAWSVTINNFWCINGGGPGDPQGTLFGGGQWGETTHVTQGYIDDGTGTHGAGTKIALTSGGYFSSSSGSQIWIPGGAISIANNVRIDGAGNVTNLAPTVIGSPGSPVTFSNVGAYNLQMEGIINTLAGINGFASNGESGTSFLRHFAFVQQQQNPFPAVTFTGTVNGVVGSHASGTTVSVTSAATSNYPTMYEPMIDGFLTFAGCSNCGGGTSNAGLHGQLTSTDSANNATGSATFSTSGSCNGSPCGFMTITGPCTGRFDYNLANGSQIGGLMISGAGIPEGVLIAPQNDLPAGGCAGTYLLNTNAIGTIGTPISVTGKPTNGPGLYSIYNAPLTPVGPVTMTTSQADNIGVGGGASVTQDQSGGSPFCVSGLHQGTFNIDRGYATFISPCGAPVTNTTLTNAIVTPAAANFNTGVLPYTTLSNISASTWASYTPAQKRAAVCNALLPKAGGSLDLGSGNWIGPFTGTGEVILAGGNLAVTGCGIH